MYIGAIVGAGFASGSEIALFFKGQSAFIVVLSGILLGVLSGAFVYLGKILKKREISDFFDIFPRRAGKVLRTAFLVSSLIMLAAMAAGAKAVLEPASGSYGGFIFLYDFSGAVFLFAALLFGLLRADKLKILFLFAVAATAALIVYLFIKVGIEAPRSDGGYNVLRAVAYVSMNVFLGGYLVTGDGNADKSEIVWTSAVSASVLTALLLMIFSLGGGEHTMPVLYAAQSLGQSGVAAVIILLAILTTMISAVKALLKSDLSKKMGQPLFAVAVSALAYLISLLGFDKLLKYAYPAISLLSTVFTALVLIVLIGNIFGKDQKASRIPEKSASAGCQINE